MRSAIIHSDPFINWLFFSTKNFLLTTDIESEHIEKLDDIRLLLNSIYDKSPVVIWFRDRDETRIICENMDLMGDLIQSLANFLNIEDLKVRLFFSNFSPLILYTEIAIYRFLDDCPFPNHNRQIESILRTDQWLWDYVHKSHLGCRAQEIYCEKSPYPGRRCSLIQWV